MKFMKEAKRKCEELIKKLNKSFITNSADFLENRDIEGFQISAPDLSLQIIYNLNQDFGPIGFQIATDVGEHIIDTPNVDNAYKAIFDYVRKNESANFNLMKFEEFKSSDIKKVNELSYAPLDPDKMASLRANNPRQMKKEREKQKVEHERWQRRYKEYSNLVKRMDKLVDEIEPLQKELNDLYKDMHKEAGIKGDEWTDADADRYADDMSPIYNEIQKKRAQIQNIKFEIRSEFSDMT